MLQHFHFSYRALQLFPWTTVKWIEFFEYLWWHFRFTSRHWSSLQTFFCVFLSMNCFFIPIIKKYLPHNNYKQYRKRRKQEVARRPNRNYRSLWEVRPPWTTARAVSHQLKKRWRKVEDGKIYELFSYF